MSLRATLRRLASPHTVSVVVPAAIAIAGIAIVLNLTYGVFFSSTTIVPDLSTYLLPAVGRQNGLGLLYVDYFDIKPPLIFALFVPWIALAGSSLPSMWVLYALILALMLLGFFLALLQQLSAWLALAVFGSASVVVVSFALLEHFFFVTESVGMALCLWGLVLARRRGSGLAGLFVAAMLMTLAGQVKDVFLFAPLALVPLAWADARRRGAVAVLLAGISSGIGLTIAVLLAWGQGVLPAYMEALSVKRERFPAPTTGQVASLVTDHSLRILEWLPWLGIFSVAALAATILAWRNRRGVPPSASRPQLWRLSAPEWALVWFFVLMSLAFLWQGSELSGYFALALIFPLYLALAVVLRHATEATATSTRGVRSLILVALLIGLMPSVQSLMWAAGRTSTMSIPPLDELAASAETGAELKRYQDIAALAAEGDCLHTAYDWDATVQYLYTRLPPCNRFTLPPLASQMPTLGTALQEEFAADPPTLLVIDPDSAAVSSFPYREVAASCYQRQQIEVYAYKPRADPGTTAACVRSVLLELGTHQP